MEEKIYELYCEIKNELKNYAEVKEILGADNAYSKRLCSRIIGMQKAFEIIAEESYTDYMFKVLHNISA